MMGEFIEEVFGMVDKVIISVVVVAVLGTVAIIACGVIKSVLEDKEYTKKIQEDEERRKKRLEKIPIEARKCSNCRYGKKVVLSDMTVYECSHPDISDNDVIESYHVGCQAFDTEITLLVEEKIRRNERLYQKNEKIEIK